MPARPDDGVARHGVTLASALVSAKRRYFGTDGVRGVVGRDLTTDLVERLGRAATLWAGGDDVLIGRDTRGSGPELEAAFVRGVVSAGGRALLAGVLPTPAVPLLADGALGVVVSASHNPPEYNGVKLFDPGGSKLADEQEEEIEALLNVPGPGGGSVERLEGAAERYLEHVLVDAPLLRGLRIGVDCANGAFSGIAPDAFRRLGAEVHAVCDEPDGTNINVGCGATDLGRLSGDVVDRSLDFGVAFDGDGDRMLAVGPDGEAIDGDGILAIIALDRAVALVAVTEMTNLGFHHLMAEHGIRVVTTKVGDRYVLEALRREGGVLGGEQSGHIIVLDRQVTGDGLVAALLFCAAAQKRPLTELAGLIQRLPQVRENVPAGSRRELSPTLVEEVERINAELGGSGRVLVRASGTEPVVRVLVEAPTRVTAEKLSGILVALVTRELG